MRRRLPLPDPAAMPPELEVFDPEDWMRHVGEVPAFWDSGLGEWRAMRARLLFIRARRAWLRDHG